MRIRLGIALLMLAPVLALPAGAQYYGDGMNRTILVTGQAAVKVVPDEVVLVVGVETVAKELQEAKTDNDARIEAALAAARRHGVSPEKIRTDYLSVEPDWEKQGKVRNFLGYWLRRTMIVTLRDLAVFDGLLADLLSAGVTHVHDIEFRTTELRKHRDEARRLAAGAAREKGESLARELGAALGEAISIREERGGTWSGYRFGWGRRWDQSAMQNTFSIADSGPAEPSGTLAPGEISVEATVAVSFRIFTPARVPAP